MRLNHLPSRSSATLLAAFAFTAALFAYSFRIVRVQGTSMEPTYENGQWLLVRRLNWPAPPIGHDEVIVFRLGRDTLVKRVAALPGEVPPVDDLRLVRLLRPMPHERSSWISRSLFAEMFAPVPARSLYVLGDNPPRSDDSRYFGAVPESNVIGRVVQWNPPDPPERPVIGYTPNIPSPVAPPHAREKGRKVLALAQVAHP